MDRHSALVGLLGNWVEPASFQQSADGFTRWLAAVGVRHTNPRIELIVPPNDTRHLWERARMPDLFPDQHKWPRLGAVELVIDHIRRWTKQPVIHRYGFRPASFNDLVGGAPDSDHVHACGVDLVFRSNSQRLAFMRRLQDHWAVKHFHLSLGSSPKGEPSRRLHVGVMAPHTMGGGRQRMWKYVDGRAVAGDIW